MELHLIRHPRPDVAPGICYGSSDVGLAEDPATVAARLRPLLPAEHVTYTSPLSRARLLAEQLGNPQQVPALREMSFGDWELRPYATLGTLSAWEADPLGFAPPGGESARALAERVLGWLTPQLAEWLQTPQPRVIIAHGGPLRVILGQLLGMPAERWLALDFACGQVTRIDLESWGSVLRWFNRTTTAA